MNELSYVKLALPLPAETQQIFIAYSGGVDSHALLHLYATQTEIKHKITAVYIHHGLQTVADDWQRHCQQQCSNLGVAFQAIKVDGRSKTGESPEAAARQARYTALKALLQRNDVLLLAQHREDQMETLLLQLFRGGGVHGLAAMPAKMPFGTGLIMRPLLEIAKSSILAYAQQYQLHWVEDPSNRSNDFDRNFLRNQVIPLLKQRWPSLDKTVARSAKHCAAAACIIEDWTLSQQSLICDEWTGSLLISEWLKFNPLQRKALLRTWLHRFGVKPPSEAVLQEIITQVMGAGAQANPQLLLDGHYIRKFRDQLFCMPAKLLQPGAEKIWDNTVDRVSLDNDTLLVRNPAASGIEQQLWHTYPVRIGFRQGGEKLKLAGRDGRHSLKKLYQEAGIPPWERDIRPLIYINDQLASVAGLWIAEWAWRQIPNGCYAISWLDKNASDWKDICQDAQEKLK